MFKLVSCKPGASRELALRPPKPEKLRIILNIHQLIKNFLYFILEKKGVKTDLPSKSYLNFFFIDLQNENLSSKYPIGVEQFPNRTSNNPSLDGIFLISIRELQFKMCYLFLKGFKKVGQHLLFLSLQEDGRKVKTQNVDLISPSLILTAIFYPF